MIASAAPRQPPAAPASTRSDRIRVILVCGSGSPMTPVEARDTSDALQPTTAAVESATARAEAAPPCPGKALALPRLTPSARADPAARFAWHHSTGADAVLDLVKTPATCVPGAITATRTSVR